MGNKLLDKDTSLQLSLLKLFACIEVVYVHAYMLHFNFFTINTESLPVVYYVQTIISQYISRVSLPIFFAVSGYIYAVKNYQENNWQFITRKAKGILKPYLLWNSIAILYIFLGQIPDVTRRYFTDHLIITNFTAMRWVESYAGLGNMWFPFLYPLWFMPYLFAAFAIVHIFRKYFYKYDSLAWIFTFLNIICTSYEPLQKLCGTWGPFLRLIYAISFFSLGMWLVKYREWAIQRKVMIVSGMLFIAAAACGMKFVTFGKFDIALPTWYIGLFFMFSFTSHVGKCSDKVKKAIAFLSGFSFLIYVTHEYMMTVIIKLLYPNLPAKTWCLVLPYLFVPIIVMSVLITGGWILKKILPKVYDFLFSTH